MRLKGTKSKAKLKGLRDTLSGIKKSMKSGLGTKSNIVPTKRTRPW